MKRKHLLSPIRTTGGESRKKMFNLFDPRKHHDDQRRKSSVNAEISIDLACAIANNGDIVLFSGESQTSNLVTFFTGSRWSHIGIIYRPVGSPPLLFESVKTEDKGSRNVDVRTGRVEVGVRLVDLRYTLETFKGHAVAMRTFCLPASFMDNEQRAQQFYTHMLKAMETSVKQYRGRPYETDIMNFVLARYVFISIKEESKKALFCSELVALCLMKAHLLPHEHSSIQFIPEDFSAEGTYKPSCPQELTDYSTAEPLSVRLSKTKYIRVPLIPKDSKSHKSIPHMRFPPLPDLPDSQPGDATSDDDSRSATSPLNSYSSGSELLITSDDDDE